MHERPCHAAALQQTSQEAQQVSQQAFCFSERTDGSLSGGDAAEPRFLHWWVRSSARCRGSWPSTGCFNRIAEFVIVEAGQQGSTQSSIHQLLIEVPRAAPSIKLPHNPSCLSQPHSHTSDTRRAAVTVAVNWAATASSACRYSRTRRLEMACSARPPCCRRRESGGRQAGAGGATAAGGGRQA